MLRNEDLQEYCAALIATATYNVYRAQHARFLTPEDLMRRRVRPHAGTTPQVRYATPTDVFPSTRPPGAADGVIERFDILAQQMKQRGVIHRG